MSLTAEMFPATDRSDDAQRVVPALPPVRRRPGRTAAFAFAGTLLVAGAVHAIATAGLNSAIDTYYAKQADTMAVPAPNFVAASAAEPEVVEPTAAASAQ